MIHQTLLLLKDVQPQQSNLESCTTTIKKKSYFKSKYVPGSDACYIEILEVFD